MEKNFMGELKLMKEKGITPNFSDLERRYQVDRHYLKRCFDLGKIPDRKKRSFSSKWDDFYDEIVEIMNKPCVTKRAAYNFLLNKYGTLPGNYNGFKSFTLRKGIISVKTQKAHVLYETEPGDLIQFDWKESLSITLKNGTNIRFNVFSATLAFSREHIFIYSRTKTKQDVIRCLIETFKRLGGTPKRALTDNMGSIVEFLKDRKKKVWPEITQLMKDLNMKLVLSKVHTPQTKGKDENANKFIDWLRPYENELENEEELIRIIEDVITAQANNQVNTGTNVAPSVLFQKEKEYLEPIGNRILLENYIQDHKREIVPCTLLISWKGKKYSVSQAYIGKYVDIYGDDESIYIYQNQKLIAIHTISQNKYNYNREHYKEALSSSQKYSDADIESWASKNLEKLSKLGGN